MPSFCTRCGSPFTAAHRFCVTCGAPVQQAPTATPPPPAVPPARGISHPSLDVTSATPLPAPPWGGTPLASTPLASAPLVGAPLAGSPAPGSSQRGPGRAWIIGGLAAAVLVAACVGGAIVLTGSEDDTPGTADGGRGGPGSGAAQAVSATSVSIASQPPSSWTVTADELLPGSTLQDYAYEQFTGTEAVLAEAGTIAFIVTDDDSGALVGLAADDGEELWRRDVSSQGDSTCWPLTGTGRLGCALGGTVELLDATTGDTVANLGEDGGVSSMVSDGTTVWIASYVFDGDDYVHHPARITAYDADGEQLWSSDLDDESDGVGSDVDIFDGGVSIRIGTRGLETTYGNLAWLVDPADGSQLDHTVDGGYPAFPDDYGTISDESGTGSLIYDEAGGTVQTTDDYVWAGDDFVVVDGTFGAGASLRDLATGEERWSRPDLLDEDGYADFAWSPDGRFVLVGDPYDGSYEGTTVLDARDGSDLFHSDASVTSGYSVFTDDAIAVGGAGRVSVWSLRTNEVAWSEDLSAISESFDDGTLGSAAVSLVGDGLLASADRGVTYFSGFPAADDTPVDPQGTLPGGTGDGGTAYATPCGSDPIFTPVSTSTGEGNLTIVMEVTAYCPSGQRLDASQTDITVTGPDGIVYASGQFDFSDTPYFIPGADGTGPDGEAGSSTSVQMSLTFPSDSAFAKVEEVQDGIDNEVIVVECVQDPASVPTDSPSEAVEPGAAPGTDGSDGTATEPGSEAGQETALQALQRIAAEDEDEVFGELVDHWIPQLASHTSVGVDANGRTWSYEQILAEHLALRNDYPGVKLLYSSDWNFQGSDFWVTMTGLTYQSWRPALRYCYDQGFDQDNCVIKLLYRRDAVYSPVTGTTHSLTADDQMPAKGPKPPGYDD